MSMAGFEEFRDAFMKVAGKAADMRPVWSDVGDLWKVRQAAAFGKLPKLKPETVRRKGGKSEPLVRTGALARSTFVHSPILSDAEQATFGVAKGDKSRGLAVMQARGTPGRMPKRVAVKGWSNAERDRIVKMITEHVMGE